jgi:hypothetical protein
VPLTISAKPDGVGAACQQWILTGEQSGLLNGHRDDGKRFVVRADEKLTAFTHSNSRSGSGGGNCLDTLAGIFLKLGT